jgi:hypothetical protein
LSTTIDLKKNFEDERQQRITGHNVAIQTDTNHESCFNCKKKFQLTENLKNMECTTFEANSSNKNDSDSLMINPILGYNLQHHRLCEHNTQNLNNSQEAIVNSDFNSLMKTEMEATLTVKDSNEKIKKKCISLNQDKSILKVSRISRLIIERKNIKM